MRISVLSISAGRLLVEQPFQQGEDGVHLGGKLVRVGAVLVPHVVDHVGVEEEVALGRVRRGAQLITRLVSPSASVLKDETARARKA